MVVRANLSQAFPRREAQDDCIFTVKRGAKPSKLERFEDEFIRMWIQGFSYNEIAEKFQVDKATLAGWKRQLKLPSRKKGRHKRHVQIKYMTTQLIPQMIEMQGMRPARDIFLSWAELDSQGRHTNGTDKETNHHYGDAYDDLFRSYDLNLYGWYSTRDKVQLIMEVGIADGSSLCAWREIFPNALCVGLDIHHSDKAHGERIEFHLGDQRLKVDCERAAAGRMFDFIVEDATHVIGNTLLTLYWLWPFVKPGGLYVVEEWDGVADRERVRSLFPSAQIIDTIGPSGGVEPLVVLRKPH